MINKLSERIIAHSLKVLQSVIGERLDKLLNDKSFGTQGIEFISSYYSSEKSMLEIEQTTYLGEKVKFKKENTPLIVKFSLRNIDIWLTFPNKSDCRWSTIYLNSAKIRDLFIDYFNNRYTKNGDSGWYNREADMLIYIFFIEKENQYAIVAMKNDKNAEVVKTLFEWSMW